MLGSKRAFLPWCTRLNRVPYFFRFVHIFLFSAVVNWLMPRLSDKITDMSVICPIYTVFRRLLSPQIMVKPPQTAASPGGWQQYIGHCAGSLPKYQHFLAGCRSFIGLVRYPVRYIRLSGGFIAAGGGGGKISDNLALYCPISPTLSGSWRLLLPPWRYRFITSSL